MRLGQPAPRGIARGPKAVWPPPETGSSAAPYTRYNLVIHLRDQRADLSRIRGEEPLQYQTDYVLRLIEELGGLIRLALEKVGAGSVSEKRGLAGQAIGLALNMDPGLASDLSPASLAALLRLSDPDERVVALVGQAIEIDATALEESGDPVAAAFRREQAGAVRSLLGTTTRGVATNPTPGGEGGE